MYKCDKCGKVFEKPIVLKDDAGIFNVSPCCREGYTDAYKCKVCNEWKECCELQGHICYECAENKYTDRLGLEFIEQYKEDFYINYLWGIEQMDKDLRNDLIDILEKEFITKIDMDTDWNGYLKKVKDYTIGKSISEWIEFLEEEEC